jgi:hypothetical protein
MCIEVTNGSFIRGNGWSRSTNNKTGNQFGLKTEKPVKSVASLENVNSHFLKYSVKHRLHPKMICEYE